MREHLLLRCLFLPEKSSFRIFGFVLSLAVVRQDYFGQAMKPSYICIAILFCCGACDSNSNEPINPIVETEWVLETLKKADGPERVPLESQLFAIAFLDRSRFAAWNYCK